MPGFGQLLNGRLLKGFLFIGLEFLININSNLNQAILLSFHGDSQTAVQLTDYQWLMFYPCVYLFAIWDSFHDAGGGTAPYSFLPFVFAAYLGTVGVIFSRYLKIAGVVIGPVWLPLLFILAGGVIGLIMKRILLKAKAVPQ